MKNPPFYSNKMTRQLRFEENIHGAGPGILDGETVFCYCRKEVASEIMAFYKPKSKLKDTFEQRKREFGLTLKPFVDKYGFDMIQKFYRYWTEPNKGKTKFRQEMEKTWGLERRLDTWYRNNNRSADPTKKETSNPVIGRQDSQTVNQNAQNWNFNQ